MHKKLIKIFLIIMCLQFISPNLVYAEDGGGTGGGDGNTNNSSGGGTSCGFYWQFEPKDEKISSGYKTAAVYKFDLVYKPKNGNREIIKTLVTYDENSLATDWYRNKIKTAVERYVTALKQVQGSDTVIYKTSGSNDSLFGLAKRLSKGEIIDNIFNNNKLEDNVTIKKYITSSDGFNISASKLQREHDNNPGRYDSYGYRILIQKVQTYNICDSKGGDMVFAATRKEAANAQEGVAKKLKENLQNGTSGHNIEMSAQTQVRGTELWTTRDDIGIKVASSNDTLPFRTTQYDGSNIKKLKSAFADWNYGLGYNILWFSTESFNSDYSIDAACVNCNSKISDNKAYVIQDTTNWTAIKNSKNFQLGNNDDYAKHVRDYFYKTDQTYCREEYIVKFPNINNTIKVATGRYFTVNMTDEEQKIYTTIPNFKPVQVTKTRICKGGNLEDFKNKSAAKFKNTGKVYFKYIENYKNSKYTMSKKEEMKAYDKLDNYTAEISGDTLTMSVTRSYTLPSNYYRYIRKKDGLSIKKITTAEATTGKYEDVGVSNLPISFNNYSTYAGDIKFSYELPSESDDPYTKIKTAYEAGDGQNNYFKSKNNEMSNIYKKYYSNQSMSSEEQSDLQQSACAKLYGFGTTGFKECAKNRQSNKIGDSSSNCFTLNKQIDSSETSTGYSCIVGTSDNTETPSCRYENGKYYDKNGNEITKTQYESECDNSSVVCKMSYNYKTNKTEYYGKDGKLVTKDEYNKQCPTTTNCPKERNCPQGCCPSGACAMPGGVCPGTGGRTVIYRTIDLENPFPGQSASQRKTGSNWCSYNIKTQQIDCSSTNSTVKKYITDEGKKVQSSSHVLYKVTLNSKTIDKIRKYNDNNKYDDWNLTCNGTTGRSCISKFLRSTVTVTGKCIKSTTSNFDDCVNGS